MVHVSHFGSFCLPHSDLNVTLGYLIQLNYYLILIAPRLFNPTKLLFDPNSTCLTYSPSKPAAAPH